MVKTGRILHFNPNQENDLTTRLNTKLETNSLPIPEIDLTENINFYNNSLSHASLSGYDQFYAYTKIFPLFDPRRMRENRQYQPDVWAKINEQEKTKAVPATTSMNYGKRLVYGSMNAGWNRKDIIKQFYKKKGMYINETPLKYTESSNPHQPI